MLHGPTHDAPRRREEAAMSDPIGQTFGSYMLESLIGAGPNGRVYRARQVRLNRGAAVKILASRLSNAPDFARRFSAAMQRTATLRSPNIAEVEDFGEQHGLGYIAMEIYDGGSLRSFLQQRVRQRDPWQLAPVLDLVRQAADGVAAAHQVGLIHGHLKPENILLQRRGQATADDFRARVGDFGLLEIAQRAPITTLAYTTPEQSHNEPPTSQSDIYALGVVLYEVATGYVPFAVKTPEEAAAKHGGAQPVPPRIVRAELPIELEQIILRCLAKRPEQRFGSMQELSQALGNLPANQSPGQTVLLAGLPTQVLNQPPPQLTQAMPSDPTQQPTVRVPAIGPEQQPTVLMPNLPKVELIDAQGNVQRALDLTGAGLTFGRAQENALVLEHEQISRMHARVDWNGRQATISDLGSANGTLIDGVRLPPNVPVPWGWTQRAQVGPFTLRVVPPPGVAMQPAAQPTTDPLLLGLLGGMTTPPVPAAASAPTEAFSVGSGAKGLLLDREQITLTPGQREVLGVTITNSGSGPDTVTISVEGAPGMWIGVPQQAVQVPAGGRVPMAITISVPREAESLAGDYPIIIRARSSANPGESATTRGRWTVLPFVASSVTITPRRATGRRDASYQVTVRNDGNQAETFLLTADDDTQELRYSFSDESVTLDPGQAETVGLLVAGPGRMIGGADAFTFRVGAQAGNERPANATAQFVSEAAVAPAVPIALAALAAIVALFFYFNNNQGAVAGIPTTTSLTTTIPTETALPTATPTAVPGAPIVNQFAVDPSSVAPNQAVTILWNVSGATSVDINVLGTGLPPQGSQQRIVDKTTDIVMKVSWSGGAFERRIQAIVATPIPPTATPLPPSATPVPPSATPLPPTFTPLPPSATPIPPSATPVPPSATLVPPPPTNPPVATNTPLPAAQAIDFGSSAQDASWSNSASTKVPFGKPATGAENGGWSEIQNAAQLENGRPFFRPLFTIPISGTGGFVAGTYPVAAIGQGQKFLADISMPNNTKDTTLKAQVLYNGTIVFEVQKAADGKVLPISVEMANFVGTSGTLTLRVENVTSPGNVGLYWVKPRLDTR